MWWLCDAFFERLGHRLCGAPVRVYVLPVRMRPEHARSPTYVMRPLILFLEGKRSDPAAAPMRAEAVQLTVPE
ncbi:MAG: hypothetical protein C4338_00915 [Rhodanobacteraceae bacterium]